MGDRKRETMCTNKMYICYHVTVKEVYESYVMEKGIYKSQVHEREEKLFVQIKHIDALMRWRKKYINLKSWGRKYMNLKWV